MEQLDFKASEVKQMVDITAIAVRMGVSVEFIADPNPLWAEPSLDDTETQAVTNEDDDIVVLSLTSEGGSVDITRSNLPIATALLSFIGKIHFFRNLEVPDVGTKWLNAGTQSYSLEDMVDIVELSRLAARADMELQILSAPNSTRSRDEVMFINPLHQCDIRLPLKALHLITKIFRCVCGAREFRSRLRH